MSLADLLEQSLENLAGRQLDRETAAHIVELHGRVVRGLLPYTGKTWQQSFVSKYLHFHCGRGNWSFRRPAGPGGKAVRALMADLPDWAQAYRSFVAVFVVLRERVGAESSIAASVKEIDHLLWHSA
jgi:hypothetical protein